MTDRKIAVTAIVVALLCGVVVLARPAKTIVQQIKGEPTNLGALTGPDIPYQYLKWGGMETWRGSDAMASATSTLCVISTPNATSTLKRFNALVTTATSTDVIVVLEDRANAFAPHLSKATSSQTLAAATISANKPSSFVYATSTMQSGGVGAVLASGNVEPLGVIGPSRYLVFFAKNGAGGTISQAGVGTVFAGQCNAEFDVISR